MESAYSPRRVTGDAGTGRGRLGNGATQLVFPGGGLVVSSVYPLFAAQPTGPSATEGEGHGTSQAPEFVFTPQDPLEVQERGQDASLQHPSFLRPHGLMKL